MPLKGFNQKSLLQDYGIQPNARREDESTVKFLERATWFQAMTKALQKHSEFMEPWRGEGMPDMEYSYPPPGGLRLDRPVADLTSNDLNPSGACSLACYAPLYCTDPVQCHFTRAQAPPGATIQESLIPKQAMAKEKSGGGKWETVDAVRISVKTNLTSQAHDDIIRNTNAGYRPSNLTRQAKNQGDAIYPLKIAAPTGGWPEWPNHPMNVLSVTAQDMAGNVCTTKLNVFCRANTCCYAEDYVVMTFDNPSTPDQIAPGGNITLYVLNGCPEYIWSVSGSGYSLAAATTSVPSNTLSLTNNACGTGLNLSGPVGTVTVTDKCGTSVTFKILSTAGGWADSYIQGVLIGNSASPCWSFGTTTEIYTYLDAANRWKTLTGNGDGWWCCENFDASSYQVGVGQETHPNSVAVESALHGGSCTASGDCPATRYPIIKQAFRQAWVCS